MTALHSVPNTTLRSRIASSRCSAFATRGDLTQPNFEDIKALWKERLEIAKIRLDFAIQSLKDMEEEQHAGKMLPADPSILFEYATRSLSELRKEYLRIAGIYLDLVQYGKIPSEQAWRQSNTGVLAQVKPAPTALPMQGSETVILIVDDDPSVRNVLQATIEQPGYSCLAAANGEEALALSRAYAGEIHLLLSDVNMPEMNGFDLARQIMVERPGIRILMISGYDSGESKEANMRLPFLKKPFTPQEVWRRLEQLLTTRFPGQAFA